MQSGLPVRLPLQVVLGEVGRAHLVARRRQHAFMSLRTGKGEIFAMSATLAGVRPLTVNTVSEDAPAWSACVAH